MTADVLQSDYAEKTIVFGEGKQNAKICMIGEAPGGDEEKQGRPFTRCFMQEYMKKRFILQMW